MSKFQRNSDKDFYNNTSAEFVPIACHYDQNTLLTKNGELVQIIQINGINADKISKDLVNLRSVVRKSIKESVAGGRLAFWVHTIRRKDNLDDPAPYHGTLARNIHEIWSNKNYWRDKFVNKLYISVVVSAAELKIKNITSVMNSLFPKTIIAFEEKFLAKSSEFLTNTVDKILQSLNQYGAERLTIREEGNNLYSDPMFLYRRIMQLNENACLLPDQDLSEALASHTYAVGTDKIEVLDNSGKKFAAILSIKEYQEISSDALDKFLQIPVEMIATEVFYFVKKKEVAPLFANQDYMLSVSGDVELRKLKGIDKIIDSSDDSVNEFCHQQISVMIIGDSLGNLDIKVKQASETLSQIGIVHVREDINLEKAFWAQLPGNFSYLSRMSPAILDNTAALASLHNFPTGNQYNPWGKALTILRSERGTPYFMNLHDANGDGNFCIIGPKGSGRTILTNFLLSEADKYSPTILHFTSDMDSGLFVKAKDGVWFQRNQEIINPLICEDSDASRLFMFEFFKIIAQHHFNPMSGDELELLEMLSSYVFELNMNERKLSNVIKSLDLFEGGPKEIKESLLKRLSIYLEGGKYYKTFEREKQIALVPGQLVAINLQDFGDGVFTTQFFPKERKLIEEFEYNLNTMRAVKAAIIYAGNDLMKKAVDGPRVLVVDDMDELMNLQHFSSLVTQIATDARENHYVFLSSVALETLHKLKSESHSLDWLKMMSTQIILPPEILSKGVDSLMQLDPSEFKKLSSLTAASRMFLVRQDNKSVIVELSIGGFLGIIRFLSAKESEIELYKSITNKHGLDPKDWMKPFYDALEAMNI